jgi:hypothetical protein
MNSLLLEMAARCVERAGPAPEQPAKPLQPQSLGYDRNIPTESPVVKTTQNQESAINHNSFLEREMQADQNELP